MSLLWPEFERKIRSLHRAELQAAPELRKEFKRQRKSRSSVLNSFLRRSALPLFWSILFYRLLVHQKSLELPAAVISLWAAGAALSWGHHWFQQFYASEDLVVLNLLPLTDRQIFRFQLERYSRSALWIFWELLLAYLVFGLLEIDGGPPFFVLPFAALLQSVLVVALALHAASRLHAVPLGTMGGLFRTTAILLLVLGVQDFEFTRYLVQGSQWFLPTGWVNYILLRAGADLPTLALLIPIGAIIYLARHSFERLRQFYSLEGFEIVPTQTNGQARAGDHEELTEAAFNNRRAGPTEIEDRIAARSFLQGVNWETAGRLEQIAARVLSARERVLTEFLVAQDPGWTRSLRWSFWIWLIVCVSVLALGQFGGTIVFFAAYILATASLPLFGGDWRGMRQVASGGVYLPGYSLYPIAFNAIARVLLKVNVIRIFAAAPFLVSFGAIAAYKLNNPPIAGVVVTMKLLAALLTVQPFFILFPISSTTNDTSRLRVVWWIFAFIPLLLLLMGALVAVFISRTPVGVLASYLVLALISSMIFLLYRRAYRLGKFDLLSARNDRGNLS